MKLINLG